MTTEKDQNTQAHSTLSAIVQNRIETEKVAQVPRWQFMMSEYGIWIVWALSVLIGAVAFSVMLFVFMHAGLAFYEATHDDAAHFFIEILPYIWVIVFVLMGFFAQYNLRNTKRGYRYTVWQVLLSSLFFSFIGGAILHMLGVGYFVDMQAGKNIPIYPGLERMETKIWQAPKQGRLIGSYEDGSETKDAVTFKDAEGASWKLITWELSPIDMHNLFSEDTVRVLGIVSSTSDDTFHGCAIFPWGFDIKNSFGEIRKDRQAFIEKMNAHHQRRMEELMASGTEGRLHKAVCADHSAVIRIQKGVAQ